MVSAAINTSGCTLDPPTPSPSLAVGQSFSIFALLGNVTPMDSCNQGPNFDLSGLTVDYTDFQGYDR